MSDWLVERVQRRFGAPALALPARFADARLSRVRNDDVRACATEYLDAFWEKASQGLAPVLVGRAAEWKSYAAAAIARVVNLQGRVDVEWFNAPHDALVMDMAKFDARHSQRLERLVGADLLVVDDFWEVGGSGFGRDLLVAVAAERFAQRRPVLWTANVTMAEGEEWKEIAHRYGVSFARRLKHGGAGFTVIL